MWSRDSCQYNNYAMGCIIMGRKFGYLWGESSLRRVQTSSGAHPASRSMRMGGIAAWMWQSVKVKDVWHCTSTPFIHLHGVVLDNAWENLPLLHFICNVIMLQTSTQNYWGFGLFLSSGVLGSRNTFQKLDLFPSSGEEGEKTPTQFDPSDSD
jgi:hypothetical protein